MKYLSSAKSELKLSIQFLKTFEGQQKRDKPVYRISAIGKFGMGRKYNYTKAPKLNKACNNKVFKNITLSQFKTCIEM